MFKIDGSKTFPFSAVMHTEGVFLGKDWLCMFIAKAIIVGETQVIFTLTLKFFPSPCQEQPLFVQGSIAAASSTSAALSLKHCMD